VSAQIVGSVADGVQCAPQAETTAWVSPSTPRRFLKGELNDCTGFPRSTASPVEYQ
jgi:hypothetical protein